MSTLTKETVDHELELCLTYAAGINKIVNSNFDLSITQGVIATILMTLGFDEVDSYAASVLLNMLSIIGVIKEGDVVVSLNALVSASSSYIIEKQIPPYVIEQVKSSLANKK